MSSWRTAPPVEVRAGDLAFRRDSGVWSFVFINASRRERRFSHVGIVVKGGAEPLIVHADAHEYSGIGCVRCQKWSEFFSESLDGAVYRPNRSDKIGEKIAAEARRRLGVPFDSGFDMTDTNRLYCSELVRESVNAAAENPVIGSTEMAEGKRLIAVDDCYRNDMTLIAECMPSAQK